MKEAKAIKFCKNWKKLNDRIFVTVRWTDTHYAEGTTLPIIINNRQFCGWKKQIGYGLILFTVTTQLYRLLNKNFTQYDAECDVEEYYNMMKKWYGRKKDWKKQKSIVQIVGVQKL